MNEEEKKSIEDMNRFANGIDMSCLTARQMQIILNLIDKLQKENEELKQYKDNNFQMIAFIQKLYKGRIEKLQNDNKYYKGIIRKLKKGD